MKRSPRAGFAVLLSVLMALAIALSACSSPGEGEQSPPADATAKQADSSQTVAGAEDADAPASSENRAPRPAAVIEPTTPPARGAAATNAAPEPTQRAGTAPDAAAAPTSDPTIQHGPVPQQVSVPKPNVNGPTGGSGMVLPGPTATPSTLRPTTAATFVVTNTLGRGMAIKSTPASRDPGKAWPDGTKMFGLGAEQDAYGWTWRWVRDPDGNTGWMPSNYLVQDDASAAAGAATNPTPGAGATAPAAGNTAPAGLAAPAPPPTQIIVPEPVLPTPTMPAPTSVPAATSNAGAAVTPGTAQASQAATVTTRLVGGTASGDAQPTQRQPGAAARIAGTVVVPATAAAPTATPQPQQPPQQQAPSQPQAVSWAVAFDKIEVTDLRVVSNEAGVSRPQIPSGQFQRVYFRIQNRQKQTSPLTSSAFSLTDDRGRTYTSDFQLWQIQPDGSAASFSGASVAPGGTVGLYLTFDVATDATGLVLHTRGGNDVKVEE
ncbi:MAG: hypothetical protein U0893_13070 [Chloroflexota bacterium]